MLHFNLFDEANKLRNAINSDPPVHAMLCNDEDLMSMPFKPTDLGFLVVLVPGQMHGKHRNFTFVVNGDNREQAHAFLTKHNVQQLVEGLLLVSTACTWDRVPDKMKAVTALGFGAIAFTTPERLQILGEDIQHMR
jgi:hypothetical protein